MSYASDALIDALERTNKKLGAENAKLRELAVSAVRYIAHEGCGIVDPCPDGIDPRETCAYCLRFDTDSCAYAIMRYAKELGVVE